MWEKLAVLPCKPANSLSYMCTHPNSWVIVICLSAKKKKKNFGRVTITTLTCWNEAQTIFITTRCLHTPCYFNASNPNYWLSMCAHGTITIEVCSVYITFSNCNQCLYQCLICGPASTLSAYYVSIVHATTHWDSEKICQWITITFTKTNLVSSLVMIHYIVPSDSS